MVATSRRVLLVEDTPSHLEGLISGLQEYGIRCAGVSSAQEALSLLENEPMDVVVTDVQLEGMDGLDLTRVIKSRWSDVGVVVMTSFGSFSSAVESIRMGAHHYLIKPFPCEELARHIDEICGAPVDTPRRSRDGVVPPRPRHGLVGSSQAMSEIRSQVDAVCAHDVNVLLVGESGTGKEVVARAIHAGSARRDRTFLVDNCAAISSNLASATLFGTRRGSFTGAEDTEGLLRAARDGTLFLDEISETPLDAQAKLLRAIEERVFLPVGSTTPVRCEARFITATNRDMAVEVREGRFREDLLYRIKVVEIVLPPLRDRRGDIPELVETFLATQRERDGRDRVVCPDVLEILVAYGWPGNVRELRNVIDRACVFSQDEIRVEHLVKEIVTATRGVAVGGPGSSPGTSCSGEFPTLAELQRRHVIAALELSGGVRARAAELLGVNRNRLRRMMCAMGIQPGLDFES